MPFILDDHLVGVVKGENCDPCLPVDEADCSDCVEFTRMVWACGCTCKDLNPKAAATHTSIEDCGCQDGVTTELGSIINGVKLGWTPLADSSMDELRRVAYILTYLSLGAEGANEDVVYSLYGKNSPGDCPVGIDGWTGLASWTNPVGGALVFGEDGEPIEWAEELTPEDVGITGPTGTLPNGTNCVQLGGYSDYQLRLTTSDGQFLFECHFPGVVPPIQCDRQPCCAYALIDGPNVNPPDIDVTFRRSNDCGCTPTASVKFTDADTGETTTFPLTDATELITYTVTDPFPGKTITITITQTYWDECTDETCMDSFDVLVATIVLT